MRVELGGGSGKGHLPTAFSSMILWALVFAADMAAEWVAEERKNRLRKAMMGDLFASCCWEGRGLEEGYMDAV